MGTGHGTSHWPTSLGFAFMLSVGWHPDPETRDGCKAAAAPVTTPYHPPYHQHTRA